MSRKKPEALQEAHLLYLDDLRESGVTNMYGGAEYLKEAFHLELTKREARDILLYWMATFGERHRGDEK
jgi:hypothetical protein